MFEVDVLTEEFVAGALPEPDAKKRPGILEACCGAFTRAAGECDVKDLLSTSDGATATEEVVRDEGGVVDVEGLESGALAGSDWEIGASILVVGALFPLFAAAFCARSSLDFRRASIFD